MTVIADLALEVRSKNAGPFWVTMEVFARDADAYAVVADPSFLNASLIARLYGVAAEGVQLFRIPSLNIVKISFPRPVTQGSLHDRDIHAGQHHVPLAMLAVPRQLTTPTGEPARPYLERGTDQMLSDS